MTVPGTPGANAGRLVIAGGGPAAEERLVEGASGRQGLLNIIGAEGPRLDRSGNAAREVLADLALHFPDVRASFDFVDALSSSAGDKVRPSQLIFARSSQQSTPLGA